MALLTLVYLKGLFFGPNCAFCKSTETKMKMFMPVVVVLLMLCGGCGAVRRHLDATDVARAIQLLEDGVRQVEVARRFAVSQSVVSRLYRRFQQTGLYHDRPRFGRPRALIDRQYQYLRTTA